MRISLRYGLITTALTIGIIYHAFSKYKQFYPAGVYLATAKHSLLIFANMLVVMAYFLDRVQEREAEYLNDRLKSSITDTILALTIFRDHFNAQFIFLFLLLLFFQVFHWLTKNRVEYIEHTPYNFINHIRLVALLLLLLIGDMLFIYFAASSLIKDGPNVMLLFGLEFGLLLVTVLSTLITLFINIEGIKREGRWDNKGLYILYLEFATETCKAILYLVFFGVTLVYYGLPIHIIRQIFISLRTSVRRFNDIKKYRNITNERFPDATEAELNNTDRICIVCREDMTVGKKLPCGHILHMSCLRSWLERQQSCPICRADVLIDPVAAAAAAAQPQPQPQPQPQQQQQVPVAAAQQVPAQPAPAVAANNNHAHAQPQQQQQQQQPLGQHMHNLQELLQRFRQIEMQQQQQGHAQIHIRQIPVQNNVQQVHVQTQPQTQTQTQNDTTIPQQGEQQQQHQHQQYNPIEHLHFIQQHLIYLQQQTNILSAQLQLHYRNFTTVDQQQQQQPQNNNDIITPSSEKSTTTEVESTTTDNLENETKEAEEEIQVSDSKDNIESESPNEKDVSIQISSEQNVEENDDNLEDDFKKQLKRRAMSHRDRNNSESQRDYY
ncbi:hypothetical protein PPL_04781 [Heterostelium album PN500]|uniref:RING-type E3 ubiquitin transferase n=1 Tax=Heterostelium pallidum (strain ATCC 26659 / Pp 5 / PN500) TaxID=670386 RepID=D3B8I8_HETP5|nr:hypothetical protein PPL_04781 [Heterostelium album PN500]EFA82356.1 hypothetical protein PPL_04781 [Heterostelium album PN500]|eukprot:XP_020434473.1 hypothetical protein PPL_04781 [Heterostelium album PN500]